MSNVRYPFSIADCGKPNNISDGNVSAEGGTTYGEKATYICNKGYYINGSATVACTTNGWNDTAPACIYHGRQHQGNYNMKQ